MRNKRHSKRYRTTFGYRASSGKKRKLSVAPIILILGLSVGSGYAAAKYVVEPAVNYVPRLLAEKEDDGKAAETEEEAVGKDDSSELLEDQVKVEEASKVKGYALQFGCYSDQTSAQSAMSALTMENLQIIEQDDMYKITGTIYETKKEAIAALAELPETAKAFVSTIYEP